MERPILFSTDMVCAILEGRKTQTRRIVKKLPPEPRDNAWAWLDEKCPYGQPGDRLWVKEALEAKQIEVSGLSDIVAAYQADGIEVPAPDWPVAPWKWRRPKLAAMFMPRWANRILLEIVSVRVERLQDISDADIKAEGVQPFYSVQKKVEKTFGAEVVNPNTRVAEWGESFISLWQSINGPDSWKANPWVWVIEFRRVEERRRAA